ncbi:hypothetical protein GCM10009798_20310 [Nocardioides panacihumi]|uniref:Uncharacterized protein n=1 Tax=Nocardioides panacihumi TaxID=400774 RepID=A0ABN2QZD5_9ACTN
MAEIYHWRRHAHGGGVPHHQTLRALAGGVMAIVALVALVAGLVGAAMYAVVRLLTGMFS